MQVMPSNDELYRLDQKCVFAMGRKNACFHCTAIPNKIEINNLRFLSNKKCWLKVNLPKNDW